MSVVSSLLGAESKIGQYIKPVRRGTKLYLYLAEMAPTADGGRQERIIRRVNEEDARSYGWKGESNGQNQTTELQEQETPPAGSVKREPAQSSMSTLATPEGALKEASPKQENSGEPDQDDEFKVVPRPRGFYALEPQRPDLPRGYSVVRTDSDGVTNVFCGLCPGFTCVHVEFMKKWLQTR
jgi:hypothetical protein